MNYDRYEHLKIELLESGVAVVTLNRPESLNAVNWPMHEALERVFYDLDMDSQVKAVVVTGAGRGFCSGGDQKSVDLNVPSPTRSGRHLVRNILECEVPIIAAVNGAAVGLGATLALFCDIVFAQPSARFADTHVTAGVVAGDGGHIIWQMLLGPARAKHYLLTGEFLSAEKAFDLGMIHKVVAEGSVLQEAVAYAEMLVAGPREAIIWTKYVLNKAIKEQVLHGLDTALALESLSFDTPGRREAAAAFKEKRRRFGEG